MTQSAVLSALMISSLLMALPGCGEERVVAEAVPAAQTHREPESQPTDQAAPDQPTPATTPVRQAGPFDARVIEIAATYQSFTRVSEHASWAMLACDAPPPARGVLQSTSNDSDTRSQALLSLCKARE